uniref:Uncharacterized protein n=1 Tax=Ralstonia syzygii R24 TaxID=907261 RepID=G3A332_9RALS|nr:hypothetical protein RALSY_30006 [Ralstonia syzygii R24]
MLYTASKFEEVKAIKLEQAFATEMPSILRRKELGPEPAARWLHGVTCRTRKGDLTD